LRQPLAGKTELLAAAQVGNRGDRCTSIPSRSFLKGHKAFDRATLYSIRV